MEDPKKLKQIFTPYINNFKLHSRIHAINEYIQQNDCQIYIKRDDELSSGIAGSKIRKYTSILPFLKQSQYDEVVVIGGAYSNHVVGILQLFIEYSIPFKLMLLENHSQNYRGNLLWIKILSDQEIIWISRKDWPHIVNIAEEYRQKNTAQGKRVFIMEEGGDISQALPGTLSLAYDICSNEKQNNIVFDHIFVDSGTGVTSIGLFLGFQFLKRLTTCLHITLIAGDEDFYQQQLDKYRQYFYSLDRTLGEQSIVHQFHSPPYAVSFGAVNKTILKETIDIARNEGILVDPVYSTKHLLTAKHVIREYNLSGNILIVYSGGSLGLCGFQEQLANLIKNWELTCG